MMRLFAKVALAMLAASFLAFGASHLFKHLIDSPLDKREAPQPLRVFAHLLRHEFASKDYDATRARIDTMSRELNIPMNIGKIDDRNVVPEDIARRLSSPGEYPLALDPRRTMLYISLSPRQVLVLGPDRQFRPPPDQWTIVMVALINLLIVGVTALLVTLPMVRRLSRMKDAADAIGRGDFSARAAKTGPSDAIGSLAIAFNHMAETTQRLVENQRHLLQAVAHELRTPMARIRFGLEMFLDASSPQQREQRVKAMDDDLSELDDIVEELLLFNRFEDGAPPVGKEYLSATAVLLNLVDSRKVQRPEVMLELDGLSENLPLVYASSRAFARAMGNLLSNALRYARSRVCISMAVTDGGLRIAVADDGPGIPRDKWELVFEPFARLDPSRTRESGGVGLGLALVKRITNTHDATVYIEDTPGGGATVVTLWPASREE